MTVRIALAGRVALEAGGAPVGERGLGPLGRLALAYLVLERDRPATRHELAEALWGERLPRSWETSVRVLLSKVRAVLTAAGLPAAEVLVTTGGGYQLRLPAGTVVDVEEAARALDRAEAALAAGDADAAREEASAAAEVAGRRLLPGASGLWLERRQGELADVHVRALETLSDACAAAADWAGAAAAGEAAVAAEPFRESAHLRLVQARAGSGNRAEGLRAYERVRRLLAEELGVDPSPALQAAHRALLGEEPSPPRPGHAPGSGPVLPLPLTSFVGRSAAIAEVERLLASTRLLSLTGTGGVGKTRLALEIAASRKVGEATVAMVELGPLSDPALVPEQARSTLGISEQPGRSPIETVAEQLADRTALVVLDNCEHVLDAAAGLAEALLRACPGLRILATTREPLRVPGETTWRVPSLSVPPAGEPASLDELAGYEAVRLFLDRARSTTPGLAVDDRDASALAQVARRLDGIPLALELAAARMGVLSVAELCERLDDRFRLLAGGSRTAPSRHQTLRAAVDWTYEALAPEEAALFDRLSMFAGTFTLDAAEEVCAGAGIARADVLGLLAGLVDRSLVIAEQAGGATRYRLLETMRSYGRERLAASGAHPVVADAHLAWVARLARQAEGELRGPDQGPWLEVVEAALDDVRAALRWGIERRDAAALEAAGALERFWDVRGYLGEGRRWLGEVLDAAGPAAGAVARAKALRAAAILAQRQGDYEPARALHNESLALATEAGDRRGIAAAVHGLGNVAALQGDLAAARACFEEALAIGRDLRDDHVAAAALTNLGTVAHNQASFAEARAFYEESLRARRDLGDRHGIAMVVGNLAYLAFQQGDHAAARALYEESLALQRELGDRPGIANSLCNLGYLALAEGDHAGARSLLEESLTLARELGDRYWTALSLLRLARLARAESDHGRAAELDRQALTLASELGAKRALAEWLEGLARTAVAQGEHRRAVLLLGAAQAVREDLGAPVPPAERPGRDADLAAARSALGDAAFSDAWTEGAGLPLERAVAVAGAHHGPDEPAFLRTPHST